MDSIVLMILKKREVWTLIFQDASFPDDNCDFPDDTEFS